MAMIAKCGSQFFSPTVVMTLFLVPGFVCADDTKATLEEAAKDLQKQYRADRANAEKNGVLRKFAPQVSQRAEQMVKKGDDALAGGRLMEARAAFFEARWLLPSLPAGFPSHVARVFGVNKTRHAKAVNGLAFSPD